MVLLRLFLTIIALILNSGVQSDILQTQILEARQLYPLRSYKDIQLFQYTIPSQVTFASFQYKANGSFHCPLKTIAVYLQYGSYPVMNLQNSTYPEFFIVRRMYLHDITLLSNLMPVTINITNPLPGNWYAAAFLVENTERIAQKGLFIPCISFLSTSVKFAVADNIVNLLHNADTSEQVSSIKHFRFFAPKSSWATEISIINCSSFYKCPVIVRIRQFGIPLDTDEEIGINCTIADKCLLRFIPATNNWNYISVENVLSTALQFRLAIQTDDCKSALENDVLENQNVTFDFSPNNLNNITENGTSIDSIGVVCWPEIPLIRISFSTNLAFEYNLFPEEEDIYPFILNISNSKYTLTSFEVLPTIDIGGTLFIELAVSPFMNISQNNVSVSGCLSYGIRPDSELNETCAGQYLIVNTSTWEERFSTFFIPYPEAGTWYFRLKAECYASDFNTKIIVPCELMKTPIYLRIRSAPCVLGNCGRYGNCYQYVSGGLIFSTCTCIAGIFKC